MLTVAEAKELALDFLVQDFELSTEERDWFTVLDARSVDNCWYIVEVGLEGLPDKWILQVYEHGECDPCYTFVSPLTGSNETADLVELPEGIAKAVAADRANQLIGSVHTG